ncbi:MAG TPA: ABC transporter substrate-binding protein [Chloroflexota bacterium]|nr:ABC transporter substrate-binding protein [Chloroflexota bacterium]
MRARVFGLLVAGVVLAGCGGGASAPGPSAVAASAPGSAAASAKPAASTSASAKPAASAAAAGSGAASAKPAGSAAATTAGSAAAANGQLTKISIGLLGSSSDGGIFIADEKGYFKDAGIQQDVQRFQTLVDMVAPMAANQLDIGAGAPAAGLYNAIGRDVNLKIVADKGDTRSAYWDFSALVIRKDLIDSGKVKDYQDLKGLNLVASGKGNSPEVSLVGALKKGGLTLSDVNYTNMGFPDMVTAIANKAIDGGIVIEPFISTIEAQGTGVRWKTNTDILGQNQQVAVIVYGPKILGNQDLARRWMTAYVRGVRDYNDAFGPKKQGYDDAVKILAKDTTVKDPNVYAKMKPAGLDPDGKLDVNSLQSDINYYQSSGQLKAQADLSQLVDASFQQAAVQQLGPYKE